ncbi:MAG: hypothetical protein ABL956_05985 [Hyphomonadaceae bacterium]
MINDKTRNNELSSRDQTGPMPRYLDRQEARLAKEIEQLRHAEIVQR